MTLSLLLPLPAMMDNYRGSMRSQRYQHLCRPILAQLTVHICTILLPSKESIEYVYKTGQKVMDRTSTRLGKLLPGSPEDIRFCGSFGVSAEVAKTTWELMEEHGLHPPGSDFLYFL